MPEHETQNILGGVQRRQVNPDHRLHLDNAGSDFDEPQAQRVELRDAPHLTLWHRHAQAPHEPVGAGMQEQPELVGRGLAAGGAVGRQMHLLGLDVVFRLAASPVDILVKYTGVANLQVVTMKRASGPSAPVSTRATIRSTRLQLATPSKNSLKRRALSSFGATSRRAFVLASISLVCRRTGGGAEHHALAARLQHQCTRAGLPPSSLPDYPAVSDPGLAVRLQARVDFVGPVGKIVSHPDEGLGGLLVANGCRQPKASSSLSAQIFGFDHAWNSPSKHQPLKPRPVPDLDERYGHMAAASRARRW